MSGQISISTIYLMPDAVKDLESIQPYSYIADKSGYPEKTWVFFEKLRHKCQELEIAPLRGQQKNDLMDNLRIIPLEKKAVEAFLADEEMQAVLILNIFYGGRDHEALLTTQPQSPRE